MTQRELERRARHKLAVIEHVEEVSGSVAATCRYYGISRTCYYRWLKRYEQEGLDRLKDRSSAPHNSFGDPRLTAASGRQIDAGVPHRNCGLPPTTPNCSRRRSGRLS